MQVTSEAQVESWESGLLKEISELNGMRWSKQEYAHRLSNILKCPLLYNSGALMSYTNISNMNQVSEIIEKEAYLTSVLPELTSRILDLVLDGVDINTIINQVNQPSNMREIIGANALSSYINRQSKIAGVKEIFDEAREKGFAPQQMVTLVDKMFGIELDECLERLYNEGMKNHGVTDNVYSFDGIKSEMKDAVIAIMMKNRTRKLKDITYDELIGQNEEIDGYFINCQHILV